MENKEVKKVALLSAPRSGSTWIGEVLGSSPNVLYRFQPNFSYSFKPSLERAFSKEEFKVFTSELLKTEDSFVSGRISLDGEKRKVHSFCDCLSHLLWKEVHSLYLAKDLIQQPDTMVVGLVRSPYAVLNSWRNAKREFNPEWDFNLEWKKARRKNIDHRHYYGYEKWKEANIMFLSLSKKYPTRFKLLSYSKVIQDPLEEFKILFEFLGIPFSSEVSSFIYETTTTITPGNETYGVKNYRKKDDSWTGKLPRAVVDYIEKDLQNTELRNFI